MVIDAFALISYLADRVTVRTLACVAVACLAWLAWLDHDGATS